jgi:hypothetical protein
MSLLQHKKCCGLLYCFLHLQCLANVTPPACLLQNAFQRWPVVLATLGPLDLALAVLQGLPAQAGAYLDSSAQGCLHHMYLAV